MATREPINLRIRSNQGSAFSSLHIEGFKSLAKRQMVSFPGLTLLAGANSCGKSSAMQPLLLMKQTIEAPFDPGTFRLDGPNLRFTKAGQLFTRGGREFSVRFQGGENTFSEFQYLNDESLGLVLSQCTESRERGGTVAYSSGTPNPELQEVLKKHFSKALQIELELGKLEFAVEPERCFLRVRSFFREGKQRFEIGTDMYNSGINQRRLRDSLAHLIHLPGLRGNPERLYSVAGRSSSYPGTFDSYFANIIWQWQDAGELDRLNNIGESMAELGLTRAVKAERIDDTKIELKVARTQRASRSDFINIADVGLGVSQVLPFIVALEVAEPGQMLFVEQPEIHLHPKSQGQLSNAIIAAVKRGVLVVVETHSSILIRTIQTSIAEAKIDKSKVALHWFERDPSFGHTTVRLAKLDDDGAYGDWPIDFDDVYLSSERRYLDAVMSRRNAQRKRRISRG